MPVMVVMPWLPTRVMHRDPSRIVSVPPIAVAPMMMFVPVAVCAAPFGMVHGPFGMILPEPLGTMLMPPFVVMPMVVLVMVAPSMMLVGVWAHRD